MKKSSELPSLDSIKEYTPTDYSVSIQDDEDGISLQREAITVGTNYEWMHKALMDAQVSGLPMGAYRKVTRNGIEDYLVDLITLKSVLITYGTKGLKVQARLDALKKFAEELKQTTQLSKGNFEDGVIEFRKYKIRCGMDGLKPWFVMIDVAECVGVRHPEQVLTRVYGDTPLLRGCVDSRGRAKDMATISEEQLYVLAMRGNSEKALEFQRWIAGTVLPTLRLTGVYHLVPEVEGIWRSEQLADDGYYSYAQVAKGLDTTIQHVKGYLQDFGWKSKKGEAILVPGSDNGYLVKKEFEGNTLIKFTEKGLNEFARLLGKPIVGI